MKLIFAFAAAAVCLIVPSEGTFATIGIAEKEQRVRALDVEVKQMNVPQYSSALQLRLDSIESAIVTFLSPIQAVIQKAADDGKDVTSCPAAFTPAVKSAHEAVNKEITKCFKTLQSVLPLASSNLKNVINVGLDALNYIVGTRDHCTRPIISEEICLAWYMPTVNTKVAAYEQAVAYMRNNVQSLDQGLASANNCSKQPITAFTNQLKNLREQLQDCIAKSS